MSKKKCVKRSKLGECIEWEDVAGYFVPNFREEDRKCNPKLAGEWDNRVANGKIATLPIKKN